MRDYLVDGVPLRDPLGKFYMDYTRSVLVGDGSRATNSGSTYGFHGDVSDLQNWYGTARETVVLNVLGDSKEEHDQLVRGFEGLFGRKDFPVLSAPQRSPLAAGTGRAGRSFDTAIQTVVGRRNLCPNPQPTSLTGWAGAYTPSLVQAPWNANRQAVKVNAASDLAVNGTFETDASSWTPLTVGSMANPTLARSTAAAHSGAASLATTFTDGGSGKAGGPSQAVSGLQVGAAYKVRVWVMCPSGSESIKPTIVTSVGALPSAQVPAYTAGVWQLLEYQFTATASTITFSFRNINVTTSGQMFYVDDVQFFQIGTIFIWSPVAADAVPVGTNIVVRAKVWCSNPLQNMTIRIHQRSPNTYHVISPIASGWGQGANDWRELTLSSAVAADIPAGTLDVSVLGATVSPGDYVIIGDISIETGTSEDPANNSYFDGSTPRAGDDQHRWTGTANASISEEYEVQLGSVSQDSLRAARMRMVGSVGIERINEKTCRMIMVLERIHAFWRSQNPYSSGVIPITASSADVDLSAMAGDSNAPLHRGMIRIKGPLAANGSVKINDLSWKDRNLMTIQGRSVGYKTPVAITSSQYVLFDLETYKATLVTTDTWDPTGGTDVSQRLEVGQEGMFSVEPGSPAASWPAGFGYSVRVLAAGYTSGTTAVELRLYRSFTS